LKFFTMDHPQLVCGLIESLRAHTQRSSAARLHRTALYDAPTQVAHKMVHPSYHSFGACSFPSFSAVIKTATKSR